jgi:hypothetical protein
MPEPDAEMAIAVPGMTSFDLYAKYGPGNVVETEAIVDNCSGMNPVYVIEHGKRLRVSTSAAALIIDSGTLDLNLAFRPAKFFLHPWQRSATDLVRQAKAFVEKRLRGSAVLQSAAVQKLKAATPANVKALVWDPNYSAHLSCETIDRRVMKLRPFESVRVGERRVTVQPDFTLDRLDDYLDASAHQLRKCINDIEAAYPRRKHVILMGGKDSQLIALVPKLNAENWHVFSAEPNYPLIRDWLAQNRVKVVALHRHDGRNEETRAEFKRKIVCSDLYTNLIHIRYLPTLEKLVRGFDGECIFWLGSMPRRASLYDGSHRSADLPPKDRQFFNVHMNTFPGWQGNIHQTYSNYLGCPFFSPYFLPEMWSAVYSHLEPGVIPNGQDLRGTLAERLAGRPVAWPAGNPGPAPYKYWYFWFDSRKSYVGHIRTALAK